jgi:hypothetical protein
MMTMRLSRRKMTLMALKEENRPVTASWRRRE